MKGFKSGLVGILLALVGLLGGFQLSQDQELGGSAGPAVSRITSHSATSTTATDATGSDYITETNAYFLAPTAETPEIDYGYRSTSSPLRFDVDGANSVTVGLFMVGSSSASTVAVEIELSPDGRSAWYNYVPKNGMVTNTANASFTDGYVLATSTYLVYTPGVSPADSAAGATATPSFSIDMSDITAKAMRLRFGGSGASSTVFADVAIE